jgi:hypothetical protein
MKRGGAEPRSYIHGIKIITMIKIILIAAMIILVIVGAIFLGAIDIEK